MDGPRREKRSAAGVTLSSRYREEGYPEYVTTGWRPTCTCEAGDPIPCTVLDPFSGAGTTALVALGLGRSSINVELNAEYVEMAKRRLRNELPLLALEVDA